MAADRATEEVGRVWMAVGQCPRCGSPVPGDAPRCDACGLTREEATGAARPGFECPRCAIEVFRGQERCMRCGATLDWRAMSAISRGPALGQPPRSNVAQIVGGVAGGILLAAAVLWVATSGVLSPHRTVTGTLQLYSGSDGDQYKNVGGICWGTGGYDDLKAGATIVLKDEAGKLVGTSSLESGKGDLLSCEFAFTIHDVGDARIYQSSIGHRGGPSWTREQMEAMGWRIGLSIGD